MLKQLISLFLLFFLAACGMKVNLKDVLRPGQYSSALFSSSDKVFVPYVERFNKEGRKWLGSSSFTASLIPVNFTNDATEENQAGLCMIYQDDSREILVNKVWWEATSETQREVLIFHELGHCKLNRDHNDVDYTTRANKKVSTSIMATYLLTEANYIKYKDLYLEELFTLRNKFI